MGTPIRVDLAQLNWQPHPTIPGIEIKLLQNERDCSPVDVLVARVAQQGEIPWHIHPENAEIAYVIQGTGVLYCAADETHEIVSETPMTSGSAIVVPPGLWHSVRNIGDDDMLIFAVHTP